MYTISNFADKLVVEGKVNTLIRVVYFYAISFITLMMLIGGSISFFNDASNYVKPGPYLMSEADYKTTNMEAKTTSYAEYKKGELEKAKQDGLRGMVSSMGWILIPGAVFLLANRRIHRMEG
jgi:hypothetical protein